MRSSNFCKDLYLKICFGVALLGAVAAVMAANRSDAPVAIKPVATKADLDGDDEDSIYQETEVDDRSSDDLINKEPCAQDLIGIKSLYIAPELMRPAQPSSVKKVEHIDERLQEIETDLDKMILMIESHQKSITKKRD
jgi:hypothetical protein